MELLKLLESMRHHSWKYIVTLDEAWFYLFIDHELIWLRPEDEAPQKEKKIVLSLKMMLTVVWNTHGFHLIDVLPKSSKFNAGHYISHILSPLPEILALYQDDLRRHFVIHADNTRSHCAKTVTQFFESQFPTPSTSSSLFTRSGDEGG
jgi:hypothetical protein